MTGGRSTGAEPPSSAPARTERAGGRLPADADVALDARPRRRQAPPTSTPPTDPSPGPRRRRGRLLVALAVVVAFDLAVRVLDPAIMPTDPYGVTGAFQKERQMQALARSGPVDIVFAGTSQTLLAVSPEIVAQAAGGAGQVRSYNAAIPGGTPSVQIDWLLDVVVPTLRPRQVVLGLSSLDLAADSPRLAGIIDAWERSRSQRDDLLGALDRTLSDVSPLIEHRHALRDPGEWWRALRRRAQGKPAPLPERSPTLTPLGLDRIWWETEYMGTPDVLEWMRTQVVPTFDIDPEQVQALRDMLDELTAEGISVVLLDMPITDDLVDLHPRGMVDVAAADAVIRREAERADVPILRVADAPWPSEVFSDPIHVNGLGGDVLSRMVGELIAADEDGLVTGGDLGAEGSARAAAAA